MGEKSPWVSRIDEIGRITNSTERRRAINQFMADYPSARNMQVEIIFERNAQARGINNTIARYDPI